MAGILCVTGQAVSKWESGAGLPDVTQIVPLAQALNVSTDALFANTIHQNQCIVQPEKIGIYIR